MKIRLIITAILLAALLPLSGGRSLRALADEEPATPPAADPQQPPADPDDPAADPQPDADPQEEPPQTDDTTDIPLSSSTDLSKDSGGSKEEKDAKLVPRLRPHSDAEERDFKRSATLNDPFLNPLIARNAEAHDEPGYNPRDHISTRGYRDLQRYMVQGPKGEVQGFLTIRCEEHDSPMLGRVMDIVKLCEYDDPCQIEMQVQLDSLRPTLVEYRSGEQNADPASSSYGLEDSLHVEYLFDRVSKRESISGITSMERKRLLPFSFDIGQLDTLVRSLDFENGDWPLEAVLFDPVSGVNNLPLSIPRPIRTQMVSGEPKSYGCWELDTRIGNEQWKFWVERIEPNRVIRWEDPRHSYTLMSYTQGQ